MTDVAIFETTRDFTIRFKEVKELARSGMNVELHDGAEIFVFSRKSGKGGFLGAMKGKLVSRSKTEELFSAGAKWEATK